MDNYEYCAAWVRASKKFPTALDFGCGRGVIVQKLRSSGVDAFGCDIFYEAAAYWEQVPSDYIQKGIIRRIENGIIPFPDSTFDLVLSNQVMEHVEHLPQALAEIQRVLKPGGQLLSLFPHKGVIREAHCGIPFLHRLKWLGRWRVPYAFALRSIGVGLNKGAKSRWQWARDYCDYVDQWTHYRHLGEIQREFGRHFEIVEHLEEDYLLDRLEGNRRTLAKRLPACLKRVVVRRLAGLVFTCRKRDPSSQHPHIERRAREYVPD